MKNIYYFSQTLKLNHMKNLKKLSREAAKEIKGAGPKRCTEHSQCIYGMCCKGVCMEYSCFED